MGLSASSTMLKSIFLNLGVCQASERFPKFIEFGKFSHII